MKWYIASSWDNNHCGVTQSSFADDNKRQDEKTRMDALLSGQLMRLIAPSDIFISVPD